MHQTAQWITIFSFLFTITCLILLIEEPSDKYAFGLIIGSTGMISGSLIEYLDYRKKYKK